MADSEKNDDVIKKVGDFIKTWLPIAVAVGGLVTGYFVFKAETRHHFELQQVEMTALRSEVQSLRDQAEQNRREWQRNIESEIRDLREGSIRTEFRLNNLENGRGQSRSSVPATVDFNSVSTNLP